MVEKSDSDAIYNCRKEHILNSTTNSEREMYLRMFIQENINKWIKDKIKGKKK